MKPPITLALLGDGPHGQALRSHAAPLGRIRLAPQPGADAVLIELPPPQRAAAAAHALRAGQLVLCPPPVALTAQDLETLASAAAEGGGRLLPAGEIAHSEAGRRGLAVIRSTGFGPLRTLFIAIRQPRAAPGDVLDTLLPEALSAVLAIVPGPFAPPRVNAAALFGPTRDTAIILLRGTDNVVVTIELSRCLPTALPASGLGEIELDAFGTHEAIRILPSADAVRIHSDTAPAAIPWLDAPVFAMLRTIEAAIDAPAAAPDRDSDGLDHARRLLALTDAIRAAA